MDQHWVGVTIQLVGLLVAAGALIAEARDPRPRSSIEPLEAVDNPWARPLGVSRRIVGHSERAAFRRELEGRAGAASQRSVAGGGMPSHPNTSARNPDLEALDDYQARAEDVRRGRLSDDWDRQEAGLRALYTGNAELLDALQQRDRAARRRLLLEMLGILLAVIGTVVAG